MGVAQQESNTMQVEQEQEQAKEDHCRCNEDRSECVCDECKCDGSLQEEKKDIAPPPSAEVKVEDTKSGEVKFSGKCVDRGCPTNFNSAWDCQCTAACMDNDNCCSDAGTCIRLNALTGGRKLSTSEFAVAIAAVSEASANTTPSKADTNTRRLRGAYALSGKIAGIGRLVAPSKGVLGVVQARAALVY